MRTIERFDLDCGLPLFVERHDTAKSAALTWMLPVGSAEDPPGAVGASALLSEWIWRGAGDLDARAHSEALDRCGVQRSSHVGTRHLHLSASMVGKHLAEAVPLIVSMVTQPRFDESVFEPVRDLALQSLAGLKDDPQHRAMLLVKERHFPEPLNRSGFGVQADLESITPQAVRDQWRRRALPGGSYLAAAGDVDGVALARQLNELLAHWSGVVEETPPAPTPPRLIHHEKEETNQVHIGLAFDAPPEPDTHSIHQRLATAVLSGGMSGRLFTEVREKRSLCYSVNASYAAGRDFGAVFAYSGTTPQRAQETLTVMLGEFRRLSEGIDESEFARAVTGLKSRLVMQGESTGARASSIAADAYVLGRPRTLEELKHRVESVTLDEINRYIAEHRPAEFSIVALGPEALRT